MTVRVSDTALFFVLSRLSDQVEFERFERDREVEGSNPFAPINKPDQ